MIRLFWCVLLLALLPAAATEPASPVHVPNGFVNDLLVAGLDQPTSMAFLPDGRVLYTEQKTGRVRLIAGNAIAGTPLTVPELNPSGYERGLQGVAVDPDWPSRPFVYLFYNRTGNRLWLVRYTAAGALTNPAGTDLTLAMPYVILDLPDNNPNHNSGCLRFAPDGMLMVSLGEDEDFCAAQDPTRLKGAILRLRVDPLPVGAGGPPAVELITPSDNPLATTDPGARLVWAYGMRNPWRFQVDAATGAVFACDVGESDFEEVNEIHAGDNLGWPYREGNLLMTRPECPEPGGAGTSAFKPPIVSMGRTTALTAVVSAGVYRWPEAPQTGWPRSYFGNGFYAEYYSGFLRRLTKVGGTWAPASSVGGQPNATDWANGLTAPVDFLVGPDGSLWWLSQFDASLSGATGSLNRIRFAGAPVDVPVTPVASSLSSAPNPFRETTDVWFRLAQAGPVSLTIHDLAGRRIRTLLEGRSEAGDTRRVWDGRDEDGKPVAPGLYLARLEREGGIETTRLLRLR